MIYLFLNCDEYLAAQRLRDLKAALGNAELADLNISELAANQTDAANLLSQASMMPFLAARRLLIARDYLSHLDKRMAQSSGPESAAHTEAATLLTGLADLPDASDVVFVDDSLDKRRHLWKGFTAPETNSRPSRKVDGLAAQIKGGRIELVTLETPEAKTLSGYIKRRADAKQIEIDGRAIAMLANFVGPNLRQLDNELDKLAAYASGRRVATEDVKLLVSDASEGLIWDLTDALSQRNGRSAMRALAELRRGDANPFYLLTMMARQYRIMIKVQEAMTFTRGNEYDIAKVVKESAYPVKKAMQQTRRYSPGELNGILQQLLEADHAMKTGADAETELDVLIAELTSK